jgi:hypothetical protein
MDSDQPLPHKGSTILSLTRRACLLPTGPARQAAKLNKVHQALTLNGTHYGQSSATATATPPTGQNYDFVSQSKKSLTLSVAANMDLIFYFFSDFSYLLSSIKNTNFYRFNVLKEKKTTSEIVAINGNME